MPRRSLCSQELSKLPPLSARSARWVLTLIIALFTTATATAAVINVASTADLGTKTAGDDATYSDYYLLTD